MMANKHLLDDASRRHVLDLVESTDFRETMDCLLTASGFRLADEPFIQPIGRRSQDAWTEVELEEYFSDQRRRIPNLPTIKDDWWIKHKNELNRRPTWDLICQLRSLAKPLQPGILLVEAKAHAAELKIRDSKSTPTKSLESRQNDQQIRLRIRQANTSLNRLGCGRFGLSADDHYQLANRVACAAHLADIGYQVVVLYLGFELDSYFDDPIKDENHWQRLVGGYLNGVVPQAFPETNFQMPDKGSIYMRIASSPVLKSSRKSLTKKSR